MAKTHEISNTYGKSITVAIANTSVENVLAAQNLPKNAILISQEYDTTALADVGHPSMLVTDYEGAPSLLSKYVEEKNGLHSDASNPNLISLHIDNNTLTTKNGTLSVNVDNIIDNTTLVASNGKIEVNASMLDKASKTKHGVAKVDNATIVSDNGTLSVATDRLDYSNNNIEGIAHGDNTTIVATNGVLSVNAENLSKATEANFGVVKPDNVTITSSSGVLSVDRNGVGTLESNGLCMNKADNATILQSNGVISVNEASIPTATSTALGVAKIDGESLEVGNDGVLSINNYNGTFNFIYDLNTGMDLIEQKISHIREYLDNNSFQNNIPVIKHLSCNETTTTMLAEPEAMEEPINMPMQHVYVSLNVITNCEFFIDVDYENNTTPTVELDNINYNDEYKVAGSVEALSHVWESTEMQEKNVVLLFNCKNFMSSTGPKTATTKLNITVSAKDNTNASQTVVYSIIRYNSFFIEEPEEPGEPPVSDVEYIVNESESRWIYDSSGAYTVDTIKENYDSIAFENSAYLTDPEDKSIIPYEFIDALKNQNSSPAPKLFLVAAYTELKTNATYYVFEKLDPDNFITNVGGKYIYEHQIKIKFDILHYKIMYQSATNDISFGSGDEQSTLWTITHQQHKSFEMHESNELHVNDDGLNEIEFGSYFKTNSKTIQAQDFGDNSYYFIDNGCCYAYYEISTQNDSKEIALTSYILSYDITNANIYLVNNAYMTFRTNMNKTNFEDLYLQNHAGKIALKTKFDNYIVDSYLYYNDNGRQVRESYEYLYMNGTDYINDSEIYLYANVKYGNEQDDETKVTYSYSYYSLSDNNKDYTDNNFYEVGNTPLFIGIASDDIYCYTVRYNITNGDRKYFDQNQVATFIMSPYSHPQFVANGIGVDGNEVTINNPDYALASVKSINGHEEASDLADSLTLSYLYKGKPSYIGISIIEQTPSTLEVNVPDYSSTCSIRAIGMDAKGIGHAYDPTQLSGTSYTFNLVDYSKHDILLAYVFETNNQYNYSTMVGCATTKPMPTVSFEKTSPFYVSDGNKFYAYYALASSMLSRGSVNRLEVNLNGSYMSQNSSYAYFVEESTMSYTQRFLYSDYVTSYENCIIDINEQELYNQMPKAKMGISAISYNDNEGTITFDIGEINGDGDVSCVATLSFIKGKRNYSIPLSYTIDNNKICATASNISLEDVDYMFVTARANDMSSNAYYKPIVSYVECTNGTPTTNHATRQEQCIQSFYDDAIDALWYTHLNAASINKANAANMKLEIYSGGQLAATVVPTDANMLTVDENRSIATSQSLVGLLKAISTNDTVGRGVSNAFSNTTSSIIETPVAYIHGIPNLFNGLEEHCICEVYKDYFIPRFTKRYDKFFTPYEYSVKAYDIDNPDIDILDKKCEFNEFFTKTNEETTTSAFKPRTIRVKFEVLHKGFAIYEKIVNVNKEKEANINSTTYLMCHYTGTGKSTTYFAYSYYTYCATNKYVYNPTFTYVDIDHYAEIVFGAKTNTNASQPEVASAKHGFRKISLDDNGTHQLLATHEQLVENSVEMYLTKYEYGSLAYIWKNSGSEILPGDTMYSYYFDLCQYGSNKLDVFPPIRNDYKTTKINTQFIINE